MSSLFAKLLNLSPSISPNNKKLAQSRFHAVNSRTRSSELTQDLRDNPQLALHEIHKSLAETGFKAHTTQEQTNIFQAISSGEITCEQAVFLYLALLAEAGLNPNESLINDKLQVVTMFNPSESHVALSTRNNPNQIWETTAIRSNNQERNQYSDDFSYTQNHSIHQASNTLLDLFCLDSLKASSPSQYLPLVMKFEDAQISYPSKYFYSIEVVNQLAQKIETNELSQLELRSACAQAIKRLKRLSQCPYLRIEDVKANIKWFRDQTTSDRR